VKFKLDENVDLRLVPLVEAGGYDVDTVQGEGLSGADDNSIYDACISADRILLTLDLDFSNPMRFPPGPTQGIIIVRPPRPILPQIQATLAATPRITAITSIRMRCASGCRHRKWTTCPRHK